MMKREKSVRMKKSILGWGKETLVFTRLFRVVSNVADFEVVEWCMCENEVVRVLRMVGCECRVMSVLVDCVMVVVNVHVKELLMLFPRA